VAQAEQRLRIGHGAEPAHVRWHETGASMGLEPVLERGGLDTFHRRKGLRHSGIYRAFGRSCPD